MKTRVVFAVFFVVVLSGLMLVSCSDENVMSVADVDGNLSVAADQVQWATWKPEIANKIKNRIAQAGPLAKVVYEEKVISRHEGGVVGGEATFGCKVEVPAYAFNEEERTIIAQVSCADIEDTENTAGIDFLPNQTFLKNVKITVSFDFLNIDEDADLSELNGYWFDEVNEVWVRVEDKDIDFENRTMSVFIDHFTRYGWGWGV